jgi:RNA polymerase primary sigma factor
LALESSKSDLALLGRLLAGDTAAAARFFDLAAVPIWRAVSRIEGAGAAGEAAFGEVLDGLRAHGFARLRAYDGRSDLSVFLALQCREILLAQVCRAFADAPDRAWARFERFFGTEIRGRIRRRFPRADAAGGDDIYQDVCLCLIENGYRRILAYDGQGSFGGFIGVAVERILIDIMRRETPRRRLPADIARLPELEQSVFVALAWRGVPADVSRLMQALQRPEQDGPAVAAALDRVIEGVHKTRAGQPLSTAVSIEAAADSGAPLVLVDDGPSPEDGLQAAEAESARARLVAAISAAAERRPAEERLYLQLVFSAADPLPPREIARLMARPVTEIRQIQQRVQRWVAEVARDQMEPST